MIETNPLDGDSEASVDFLKHWEPNGPWLLTAIKPDGGTETRTFFANQEADAFAWIDRHQGKRNIYFSVNLPNRELSRKASKADIYALKALHVDVDPVHGQLLENEKMRIKQKLMEFQPPPSLIIDSGGGAQAFWLLHEPIAIAGEPGRFETFNKHLETELGGDRCHNIDRIMRLPGTVNIPNAKKLALGRKPALAKLIRADWKCRYSLTDFSQLSRATMAPEEITETAVHPPNVQALPISRRMKNLIRGIDDLKHRYASRSERVFAVLIAMVNNNCTDAQIAGIFLDPRNPISAHVIEKAKPAEFLARQIERARKKSIDPHVAEINNHYALVIVGDKAVVIKFEGPSKFTLLSPAAFNTWLANRFVFNDDDDPVPLAKYWLKHPQRRQYDGFIFDPHHERLGYYNLFRGFAVEPRPGDCSLFLAHLKDNVCGGKESYYFWVVGWFAAIFQHPEKKFGTSLVIIGEEGTGKTKIGEVIRSLLGVHYLAVSDPRYISGRFNSHMLACLLLHAEEAFWAGDRAAEGMLKDLITGDEQMIEFKGKEAIRVANLLRLLVTGNPDWVVPVSMEGRRWGVFRISNAHRQDGPYFDAIDKEMANGGREALLHYLLHFDLSCVNLREVPKTSALLEQKLASLTPEHGWWLDILANGRLPRMHSGYVSALSPDQCPSAQLFHDYVDRTGKVGPRWRAIETRLGLFLRKVVPTVRKRVGPYINPRGGSECGSIYEFPSLASCRTAFAKLLQQEFDWGVPEEWQADNKQLVQTTLQAVSPSDCPNLGHLPGHGDLANG